MGQERQVIIVGSGPAGLTAALYCARANLQPLLFTGTPLGGQLSITSEIENYPGLAEGVTGPELVQLMQDQAERFGTEIVNDTVTNLNVRQHPFLVVAGDLEFASKALILATGSSPRTLGLESEQKFMGRGVSTCATCDGFFYRDRVVGVVGGGDSAVEEATYLTRFASKVFLIHRRDQLRASEIMKQRAERNETIEFVWNSVVTEVLGADAVEGVRLKDVITEEERVLRVDGLFVAIGHEPNSQFFREQIDTDEKGYVKTDLRQRTNVAGVFVAGDVADHIYRQAVTAAGTGCKAAIEAERFIAELEDRLYPGRP